MTKTIPVTLFTEDGKRIKSFKALNRCLKYIGNKYKIPRSSLRALRLGQAIWTNGHLILMRKHRKYHGNINPLKSKHLLHKLNNIKRNNLEKLSRLNRKLQKILVIDNKFKVIECHTGTIKELTKKYKTNAGTIKASLSKSPYKVRNRNNMMKAIYYVHLKDLAKFISNIKI